MRQPGQSVIRMRDECWIGPRIVVLTFPTLPLHHSPLGRQQTEVTMVGDQRLHDVVVGMDQPIGAIELAVLTAGPLDAGRLTSRRTARGRRTRKGDRLGVIKRQGKWRGTNFRKSQRQELNQIACIHRRSHVRNIGRVIHNQTQMVLGRTIRGARKGETRRIFPFARRQGIQHWLKGNETRHKPGAQRATPSHPVTRRHGLIRGARGTICLSARENQSLAWPHIHVADGNILRRAIGIRVGHPLALLVLAFKSRQRKTSLRAVLTPPLTRGKSFDQHGHFDLIMIPVFRAQRGGLGLVVAEESAPRQGVARLDFVTQSDGQSHFGNGQEPANPFRQWTSRKGPCRTVGGTATAHADRSDLTPSIALDIPLG